MFACVFGRVFRDGKGFQENTCFPRISRLFEMKKEALTENTTLNVVFLVNASL